MSGLVRHGGGSPDPRTARKLTLLDRACEVQRSHDRARAELAAGRITDVTNVTRHALGAAALIALEAEQAAQLSPWAASQIESVARAGVTGIRSVIIDLANEF